MEIQVFIPVNAEEFNDSIKAVSQCEPVMEHSNDEDAEPRQKKDKKSGALVWQAEVMYRHEQDFGSEVAVVKLKSATDPGIKPGPIRFGGLAFRTWDMGGKKGLSISADSFTQDVRSAPAAKSFVPPKPLPSDKK